MSDDARHALGRAGEDVAARYLTRRGMRILARNWRCDLGELDIIALSGRTLVAVEVKTRTWATHCAPSRGLTRAKVRRMRRLILRWRAQAPRRFARVRLDAVCVICSPPEGWYLSHLRGLG